MTRTVSKSKGCWKWNNAMNPSFSGSILHTYIVICRQKKQGIWNKVGPVFLKFPMKKHVPDSNVTCEFWLAIK